MEQRQQAAADLGSAVVTPSGSSIVTHRRGERTRTYHYQPRPEARM